jgi:predicted nuclease of restriction endonuclease-like RecB superfamily
MKRLAIMLLLSSIATWSLADTHTSTSCAEKRHDILKQIDHARKQDNQRKVAGLNKALKANDANCTTQALRAEREKDVSRAREKVVERERELNEAKAEGKDSDKIAKREQKLAEAHAELHRAQKALGN